MTETNDGIIAVAGMGLGLAGAEITLPSARVIILVSSVAGALSVFGVKVSEGLAEREAQLSLAAEEQRLLELSPEEEIAELAEWFEDKGVTPDTAHAVAEEMSAKDALAAKLQLEFGIEKVTTPLSAWGLALRAGVAFLMGSLIPVLVTFLTPNSWREGYTILTAVVALTVTSAILAMLGRARFWFAVFRTLALGIGTLALTYLLGDLLI